MMNRDASFADRIRSSTGIHEIIPDHQAATDSLVAEEAGKYKYGVRVEDSENGEVLGDDDPILIVF